jgi:hypothetical protein
LAVELEINNSFQVPFPSLVLHCPFERTQWPEAPVCISQIRPFAYYHNHDAANPSCTIAFLGVWTRLPAKLTLADQNHHRHPARPCAASSRTSAIFAATQDTTWTLAFVNSTLRKPTSTRKFCLPVAFHRGQILLDPTNRGHCLDLTLETNEARAIDD